MTQISTYLNFEGNCREAMEFYKGCLGGELEFQVVGESPMADRVPAHMKNEILHSSLTAGPLLIMASDMRRSKLVNGNTTAICIHCSSEEEINSLFSQLSAGGEVRDPLMDAFWGARFGAITDKFGKQWIFNYDKNQPK